MIDFFLAIPIFLLGILFIIAILFFLVWVVTSFDNIADQFGDRFWESAKFWKKVLKSLLIVSLPLGAAIYWEINYFGELGLFSSIGFFIWGNAGIILLCLLIDLISTKIKNLIKK